MLNLVSPLGEKKASRRGELAVLSLCFDIAGERVRR